jgi:hypothetical protein
MFRVFIMVKRMRSTLTLFLLLASLVGTAQTIVNQQGKFGLVDEKATLLCLLISGTKKQLDTSG